MSFAHQTVVVIGATGVVGGGIVRTYLDAGATVVGVSRSAANLQKLKQQMSITADEPFCGVVTSFKDEGAAEKAKEAITAALAGKPIDHVVSAQGFVSFAKPPTHSALEVLKTALDDGLYNNYLAAKALLELSNSPTVCGRLSMEEHKGRRGFAPWRSSKVISGRPEHLARGSSA